MLEMTRVVPIYGMLSEHGIQVAQHTYRNWKTASPSVRTVNDVQRTVKLRATIGTAEGSTGTAR